MARIAKAARTTPADTVRRKPGRPPDTTNKPATKLTTPSSKARTAASPKGTADATPSAPKLSKEELRAEVAKLGQANAAMRAKSRETNRTAKAAAARISELENHVAQLEKAAARKLAPVEAPAKPQPVMSKRGKQRGRKDDVMPTEVEVGEPSFLRQDEETMAESLEEHPADE